MNRLFKKSTFQQATKILFIFDNLTKLLAFLRNIVITTQYGLSKITDAYNFAFNFVSTPINLISDALLAGVIPFLKEKENKAQQLNFIYSVVLLNILIWILFFVVFYFFPNQIISFLAPGYEKSDFNMIYNFAIVLMFISLFTLITKTFEGYFRANEIFGISNIINFISTVVGFILLVLLIDNSYEFIPISQLIGILIGFILFVLVVPKQKFKFDSTVFKLIIFSLPLLLGGSLGIINNFVDKAFATSLDSGALSALTYSFLIVTVVGGIITGPLLGASFTFISTLIINKDLENLDLKTRKIKTLFLVVFLILIILVQYFGQWGLNLVFHRGEMDLKAVNLIYELILIYITIVIFSGITSLSLQMFYALKISLIPSIISVVSIIFNIVLNILLIDKFGVYGLAFSTLLVSFVSTIVLTQIAGNKIGIKILDAIEILLFILLILSCLIPVFSEMKSGHLLLNLIIVSMFVWKYKKI